MIQSEVKRSATWNWHSGVLALPIGERNRFSMDEEDESLPIFRHFTREDLAIIDNAIFENKLREKKKAEKRAQNVKVKY